MARAKNKPNMKKKNNLVKKKHFRSRENDEGDKDTKFNKKKKNKKYSKPGDDDEDDGFVEVAQSTEVIDKVNCGKKV